MGRAVWAEPLLAALVVELSQKWASLVLHKQQPDVPATNNVTERALGRTKVRYKTTRGFKTACGCKGAFALTQWLYTPAAQHNGASLLQVA